MGKRAKQADVAMVLTGSSGTMSLFGAADPVCSVIDLPPVRVQSLGGGVDSFTVLLLSIAAYEAALAAGDAAAAAVALPDLVIFADVTDPDRNDPGEWPETYAHIRNVVMPLCAKYGIEFKWLDTTESPIRGRTSLFAYLRDMNLMPSRGRRMCTVAAKVERISAYISARWPGRRLEVSIGFEAGEEERAARDPHAAEVATGLKVNRFPLMEHRMCRCRAVKYIQASGHPMPPGSACVFCPFSSRGDFQTLARELPGEFQQVVALERDCRLTKAGRTVRFSGTEDDPVLPRWIEGDYRRQAIGCEVCGAEIRAAKLVGCEPAAPAVLSAAALRRKAKALPLFAKAGA